MVSILATTPSSGVVGTTVTVSGTGFSPTPGENALAFNGVPAVVTAATPTQLVTAVPAGAATGFLTLTTPAGSATSPKPFTVLGAPTIASVNPTLGSAGTPVEIAGANFDPTPSANTVVFEGNGALAPVAAATATRLDISVPREAASGRISVTTLTGRAVSSQDFFVPVGAVTAADVAVTARMVIGETRTVTIPTAGKVALVIFDGTAGQRVALTLSSATIHSSTVGIWKPNRTALFTPVSFGTSPGFIDTLTLPATGTYTIVVDPDGTATGDMTLTLHDATEVTGTITPGGPAVTVTTAVPGQDARLTFPGTAGQRVSLNVSVTMATRISILNPDGTTLVAPVSFNPGGFIDATPLAATGTYAIVVDPLVANTGSVTLTLFDVPPDVTGPITPGGPAVTITTTTPGQNARLTFTGTAGQRVSLSFTDVTIAFTTLSILAPDGTSVRTGSLGTSGLFLEPVTLPVPGTYALLLDPSLLNTGRLTVTLFDVPPDVTGTIAPGGPAVTVTIAAPGQNARLTFSGTAGQRVSLQVSQVTVPSSFVSIFNPEGSRLLITSVSTAGAFIEPTTLPATGSYRIEIDPGGAGTGSLTLQLFDVVDLTGTLTVNGAGVTVMIATPGQTARLTFDGAAGQGVTVRLTSNSIPLAIFRVLRPDGAALASASVCSPTFSPFCSADATLFTTAGLPATGTYAVTIDPDRAGTGSVTVTVTSP